MLLRHYRFIFAINPYTHTHVSASLPWRGGAAPPPPPPASDSDPLTLLRLKWQIPRRRREEKRRSPLGGFFGVCLLLFIFFAEGDFLKSTISGAMNVKRTGPRMARKEKKKNEKRKEKKSCLQNRTCWCSRLPKQWRMLCVHTEFPVTFFLQSASFYYCILGNKIYFIRYIYVRTGREAFYFYVQCFGGAQRTVLLDFCFVFVWFPGHDPPISGCCESSHSSMNFEYQTFQPQRFHSSFLSVRATEC